MGDTGGVVDLMIRPFAGQTIEAGVGFFFRVKALGLKMIELFLDGFLFLFLRLGHRLFGLLPACLGGDHQPPLFDPIVAQIDALETGVVIQRLPVIPGPGLLDDLLGYLEAFRDPRQERQLGQERRILLGVELAIGDHQTGRGRRLAFLNQGLRPRLEDGVVRGVAIPTLAD